jgi:PAS domain S-box-containing protein
LAWRCRAIKDGEGHTVGAMSSARDITEQRQADEKLRISEERYRVLFEGSRDAIMTIEPPTWRFTSGNPTAVKMFGAETEEEFTTLRPADLSPERQPDGRSSADKAREMIETAVREGSRFFEWTHRRITGEVFPANVLLAKMESEGKVIIQATVRNITERKQMEQVRERFLQRQERLNRLQETLLAPSGLTQKLKMITDAVVDIFQADFCRIWCIGTGDLCEEGCMHALATEGPHVCRHKDKCLRLLASSGRYTHTDGVTHRRVPFGAYKIGRVASGQDHKFLTNDVVHDSRVHNHDWARELGLVSFAGYQIRPPGGETLGVLALFSKHALSSEEDAQLDSLSSTTARVIQSAQFEETLCKNEERYRTVAEHTYDWEYWLTPDGKFAYCSPSCERISGYRSDEYCSDPNHHRRNLRDFSRIDRPGSRDEYDLNEGIKATLVVARNEIKYDADVRTELSEIPLIFCHGGQVNQVLLNILVNAAQAIKSQKRGDGDRGTITVRTRACESGVVCEIADDGPGIAPEHLTKIFEPFFTTKAPGKGTGLGLSVSYDIIVHKHKGKLLVDSTVGHGTTFTIELPTGTRENDEQETMSDGTENRVVCGR